MLDILRDNWKVIAEEAEQLKYAPCIDIRSCTTRAEVVDLLKKQPKQCWVDGWDRYANWFNWGIINNYEYPFGEAQLPETTKLLKQIPNIKGAALCLLKHSSVIPPHDHLEMRPEGLLTYHLGLSVPEACYLNVNGEFIKEENGKGFVFDGSLPHFAFNASMSPRVILHCEFAPNK